MVRFKYSLTLAVETHGMFIPMWFFAISLCLLTDKFNPFKGLIYYICNILGFLLGWFVGLALFIALVEWMRKRTVWAGDWERYFGNDETFLLNFDELGCIVIGLAANILFIFTSVSDYINNSSLEGFTKSSLFIIVIFVLQVFAYNKGLKRKTSK